MKLYLIVADDRLQTAFYCGTSSECAAVLGITVGSFYTAITKGLRVGGFFRIEKVNLEKMEV